MELLGQTGKGGRHRDEDVPDQRRSAGGRAQQRQPCHRERRLEDKVHVVAELALGDGPGACEDGEGKWRLPSGYSSIAVNMS